MSDHQDIDEQSDRDSYISVDTEESWHCGCCYDPYPIDILMDRDHNSIDEYETIKRRGNISHTCIKKRDKGTMKKIKKSKPKSKKIVVVPIESEEYSDTDTYSEMTLPRGDFSFIKDNETRIMLEDAYKAIDSVWTGWEFVERDPGEGGFMFSTSLIAEAIQKEMKYDGHSGASYGWTMRKMQRLARIGWEAFVKEEQVIQ